MSHRERSAVCRYLLGLPAVRRAHLSAAAVGAVDDFRRIQHQEEETMIDPKVRRLGMQNRHESRGPLTVIFLRRKAGPDLECLIDTADLQAVQSVGATWYAAWDRKAKKHYVKSTLPGSRRQVFLHRILLDPPVGSEVDHRNHNGLDNRRSELRIVTRSRNAFNAKRRYASRSGVRGVIWNARDNRWVVKIVHDKVRRRFGSYADLNLAKTAAAKVYAELEAEA